MQIRKEEDGQISITADTRYWSSLNEIIDLIISHSHAFEPESTTLEPDEIEALLFAWQAVTQKALNTR